MSIAPQKSERSDSRDFLAPFLLVCLVILFFHDALIGGEQFYAGDTFRFFYPLKKMVADYVRAGQPPVWNPLVHSGMPLHAALQAATFYPVSVLFYLLPFDFAFKWYVAIHVMIAALGMYFLLRRWSMDHLPAALAGVAYAFSGYVISMIDGLNIFSSIVWLPVVFMAFERAVERPRVFSIVLVAFAVASQMLAGDPVSAYFTLMICGAYWMLAVANSSFRRRPRGETLAVVCVLPAVAVLALLLSTAHFGPAQELTLYSTRAEAITYATATRHSLDPLRLLTLAIPYMFGNPIENIYDWGRIFSPQFPLARSLYVGAAPLALIPLAIIAFRERRVYFLAGVFVVSLLLSLGSYTPLYGRAYAYLPMLSKFRYPLKIFFATTFAMAALFGYGLQYLLSEGAGKTHRMRRAASKFTDRFSAVLLVAGALWLIFALLDRFALPLSDGFFLRISSAEASLTGRFIPDIKRQLLQASVMFTVLGACLYVRRKGLISRRIFAVILAAYIVLDIVPTNYRAMDTMPESYYGAPSVDGFLKADEDRFRLYRTPLDVEQNIGGLDINTPGEYYIWNRELLSPNFGALFGYGYTDGYEGANLLWHNLFLRIVETAPPIDRPRLLGLVNVKYIFASRPVNHPDLALRLSPADNVFVYENARCLDRAYFTPIAVIAPDETAAVRFIASDSFDPSVAVVLVDEGGPGSMNPQPGIGGFEVPMPEGFRFGRMDVDETDIQRNRQRHARPENPVRITAYSASSVTLSVDAPSDGHVVLCDAYYPRWKAYVNGEEVKMLRANLTVRAVPVGRGNNSIEFIYDTTLFRKASLVSLGALILCVGAAALDLIFGFGRRRKEETSAETDSQKQEGAGGEDDGNCGDELADE